MKLKKNGDTDPVKPVKKEQPKPVQSGALTRGLRDMMPDVVPEPAKQLIASTVTRDNKFGWGDMSPQMRAELAKSVMHARTRTGKNSGGTEYRDYGERLERDINRLEVSGVDALLGSFLSPDFKTATTVGRVSYDYDPETDTYSVYDSYDFNQVGKSSTAYGKIREAAGNIGIQEGEPNLIATFKGSDYENYGESPLSYGNLTDFTDETFNAIKNLFK